MELHEYLLEAERVAAETGVGIPPEPYRIATSRCYKCEGEMLLFGWPPGRQFNDDDPPEGRPSSIRFVRTPEVPRGYWGNVCPHCGWVQGDWYILGYAGPFSASCGWTGDTSYSENDEEPLFMGDYAKDMEAIARSFED